MKVQIHQVDARALALVAEGIATVPAFDVIFTGTRWFGDEVLWLAPEPSAHSVRSRRRCAAGFPGCLS